MDATEEPPATDSTSALASTAASTTVPLSAGSPSPATVTAGTTEDEKKEEEEEDSSLFCWRSLAEDTLIDGRCLSAEAQVEAALASGALEEGDKGWDKHASLVDVIRRNSARIRQVMDSLTSHTGWTVQHDDWSDDALDAKSEHICIYYKKVSLLHVFPSCLVLSCQALSCFLLCIVVLSFSKNSLPHVHIFTAFFLYYYYFFCSLLSFSFFFFYLKLKILCIRRKIATSTRSRCATCATATCCSL